MTHTNFQKFLVWFACALASALVLTACAIFLNTTLDGTGFGESGAGWIIVLGAGATLLVWGGKIALQSVEVSASLWAAIGAVIIGAKLAFIITLIVFLQDGFALL